MWKITKQHSEWSKYAPGAAFCKSGGAAEWIPYKAMWRWWIHYSYSWSHGFRGTSPASWIIMLPCLFSSLSNTSYLIELPALECTWGDAPSIWIINVACSEDNISGMSIFIFIGDTQKDNIYSLNHNQQRLVLLFRLFASWGKFPKKFHSLMLRVGGEDPRLCVLLVKDWAGKLILFCIPSFSWLKSSGPYNVTNTMYV